MNKPQQKQREFNPKTFMKDLNDDSSVKADTVIELTFKELNALTLFYYDSGFDTGLEVGVLKDKRQTF